MRKFFYLLPMLMLCLVLTGIAQKKMVTGKVTNDQGQPISFSSISIKGSDKGTITDEEGNFRVDASEGQTLTISAVGYDDIEVVIGKATTFSIVLHATVGLNEVVVTAMGLSRTKNQLPFAAQKIQGTEVSNNRSTNFVSSLSGKVAGLDIKQNNTMGASTNVLVRGSKSLTGNNQALFVVDGIPFNNATNNTTAQVIGRGGYDYGNAAADINPDDIDNIIVLKGAAASALYGSRGSNGVILITTKKGRDGFFGVTVNSGIIVNSIIRNTFPKFQKQYGAGYKSAFDNANDINGDGTLDNVAPTYDDASWGMAFDPNLMVYQWGAFIPGSSTFLKATPWIGAKNDPSTFFEKPVSFNNSVFIEAGGDKGSFTLGYTRSNEKGVLPNSSLSKNLLNFSTTYKLNDQLTAGATANYSRVDGMGRFETGYNDNLMSNFRQWWQTNVDIKELKDAYLMRHQNTTWNMHSGPNGELQPEFWDNPYFVRYQSFETDSRNRYFGNVYLNYKPLNWLNILGRVSLDAYSEMVQERKAVSSQGVPSYGRFNQDYSEINYDLLANTEWNIGQDINLKGLLGSNTRVQNRSSIAAITNGGLSIVGLYTIANSTSIPAPPVEFFGTIRVEGQFAGATFTYKNAYVLDATIRRDRSSTLPDGNNVYYYPSVSGGFVFSELWKPKWLTYGKLRANYAEVGGDAPLYTVNDYYANVTSFGGTTLFSVSGTKNNSNLRPERTKSFEIGLEASILRSRLGFDITYYSTKTVNQILPLTTSTATGYSSKYINSGTIRNNGIEVSLYGTPVKNHDFSWDITLNYTRNRNKVLELFDDIDNIVLGSYQGSITVNATLNEPYGTIHGTDFIYTNGQKTVDKEGHYLITASNNNTIGNINPDWLAGIANKFTYKGITLNTLFDVKHGGAVFSTDMYYGLGSGIYEETAGNNDLGNPIRNSLADGGGVIREGVTEDGKTNTTRASMENYGEFDSGGSAPDKRFVYDAGYVKLREMSLGYSLPTKLFTGKIIKGIDVSLIGRNLAILHKNLPHSDPEEGFSAGNLQGVQTGAYPAVRSIGFNLKVKL